MSDTVLARNILNYLIWYRFLFNRSILSESIRFVYLILACKNLRLPVRIHIEKKCLLKHWKFCFSLPNERLQQRVVMVMRAMIENKRQEVTNDSSVTVEESLAQLSKKFNRTLYNLRYICPDSLAGLCVYFNNL